MQLVSFENELIVEKNYLENKEIYFILNQLENDNTINSKLR